MKHTTSDAGHKASFQTAQLADKATKNTEFEKLKTNRLITKITHRRKGVRNEWTVGGRVQRLVVQQLRRSRRHLLRDQSEAQNL